ncbi:MAG TPA: tetratricopeptide repeat protein, partial [Planctomycetia bacterium]|nr:tetratricopeptide repeat protein [Planctomycetia bacterium]
EVLDRAAAHLTADRIDRKFPNMPLVQAGVLKAVGSAYKGLFQPEKAESRLARAVQLYRAKLGPDDPATLDAEFQLAVTLCMSRERIVEAKAQLRQTLERMTRAFGPYDDRTLTARRFLLLSELISTATLTPGNVLKMIVGRKPELERSIEDFKNFKSELVARFGPEHLQVVYATYFLGMGYRIAGRLDEALVEVEAAGQAVYRNQFRVDHPDIETAIATHVTMLRTAKRNAEAIAVTEKALAMREQQKCAEGPITWVWRHQLGWAYMAEKRNEDALRVFQKNAETATPPNDETSYEALAAVLRRLERNEEAIKNLQKALDLRYARNGAAFRNWDTGRLKSNIGHVLADMKRRAEAEPLMLAGYKDLQEFRAQMPPHNSDTLKGSASRLKQLYVDLGKPEEAAKWKAEWERQKSAETPAPSAKESQKAAAKKS